MQERKEKNTIFVGLENRAANVYARVGFIGIGKEAVPTEGVDTWVELGFDPRYVIWATGECSLPSMPACTKSMFPLCPKRQ